MTDKSGDPGFHPEHDGMLLNGRAARAVYEAWRG